MYIWLCSCTLGMLILFFWRDTKEKISWIICYICSFCGTFMLFFYSSSPIFSLYFHKSCVRIPAYLLVSICLFLFIFSFLEVAIVTGMGWYLTEASLCISLRVNHAECVSSYILVIFMLSRNIYLYHLPI